MVDCCAALRVGRFSFRSFGLAALPCLFLASGSGSAAASPARQEGDPAAAMAAKLADPRLVLLHAAEFDPLAATPALPTGLTWSEEQRATRDVDYIVVQLHSTPEPTDRTTFAAVGAAPLAYVPNHAWIVRATAATRLALAGWGRVRAIVPFEPAYRVDQELLARATTLGSTPIAVMIQLFRDVDPGVATRDLFLAGAEFADPDAGSRHRLLAEVAANRLPELARVLDVQWIQPQSIPVLRRAPARAPAPTAPAAALPPVNDTTNWVVQSNTTDSTPVWDNGVLGDGVVIGHIDGAIDLDSCWFDDPANGAPGPNHRKVIAHHGSYTNSDSHGTHTAGTVAGDQEPKNGVIDDNGLAYHAKIAHTNLDLIDNNNLKTKLEELHGDGATVFTNSWGDDGTTQYDAWCVDIDEMIWENPETVICFAVTNLSTLKNPENAKNCIGVGATEQAPSQGSHCYGGQGPTSDGRRKPDLYAPGCSIQSANDGATCSTNSSSGTSMACPSVAGGAALVKHYFEGGWWPTGAPVAADGFVPSGALIKAVLIDSARDMTGESGYPTNLEGWGRMLLDHALYFPGDARALWLADQDSAGGLSSGGQSHVHWVNVTAATSEFNAALVFTDYPGTVNSSSPTVNNLNLEVVAPNGSVYKGNVFSNAFSATGGSYDTLNNVERVRLTAPPLGWYEVRVKAATIATSSPQSYALVVTANCDVPVDGGFTTYGTGTPGTGGFVPALALSGSPDLGEDISLDVTKGRGGAAALVVMGFARDNAPYAGGQLLVLPPWITFLVTLGGTPGAGGAGSISLADTIPDDDPALIGAVIDFQVLVADPAATKKIALSNGAELVIGS